MFTRVVEVTVKSEKRDEFLNLIHNDVQPTVKEQPGFVDAVGLIGDTDPNTAISVVFWNTKQDAERFYTSTRYTNLLERIRPLLKTEPKFKTYTVDTSTFHHIARGKAA